MFAHQFKPHSHELNPLFALKQKLETDGVSVLDLTLSNPTQVGLNYPAQIPRLFNQDSILTYNPHPQGEFATRKAIADYYRSRNRIITPEKLVLTASTSEAYSFLFKLLCNAEDEVLIPTPSYPLFDTLAELENVSLIPYPENLEQLDLLITTKTKAIILVNPNNPTGHVLKQNEIDTILKVASDHSLAIIVDEVFCDYLHGSTQFIPVQSETGLVFTLNGFSKMLGLPQMKLGWIHVGGDEGLVSEALQHLEWIADAFLSVNTPVQKAAPQLFELLPDLQGMIKQRLANNLVFAKSWLNSVEGIRCIFPQGGWSMVLEVDSQPSSKVRSEDFALELLKQKQVYVHPGILFGIKTNCVLVLSLLVDEKIFAEGLKKIALTRA